MREYSLIPKHQIIIIIIGVPATAENIIIMMIFTIRFADFEQFFWKFNHPPDLRLLLLLLLVEKIGKSGPKNLWLFGCVHIVWFGRRWLHWKYAFCTEI